MTVYDLNREQLEQVKQFMLMQRYEESGESPAWGDLADVDNIISDEEVYAEYRDTEFVPDDFAGSEEDDGECRVVIENANRHDISYDLEYVARQIEDGYTNGILSDGATWYIE